MRWRCRGSEPFPIGSTYALETGDVLSLTVRRPAAVKAAPRADLGMSAVRGRMRVREDGQLDIPPAARMPSVLQGRSIVTGLFR